MSTVPTRKTRRSAQTVSKSKPAMTRLRSTSRPAPSLARTRARFATTRSARKRSRGRSSGSRPHRSWSPSPRTPPTPRGRCRGRGGGGGRGPRLRTGWRRIARSNWPRRGRSARIVRPPARATGRGARMRPFGSTHADRSGIVSSPAGDRALDPGLVRPGLVFGQGLESLDGAPVGLSDLDRAAVPRPGRSSPGDPHPPGECPVRRSSARMPTGQLKPPVGFAHRPLAPPGVRSGESSTTRACPDLLGVCRSFHFCR